MKANINQKLWDGFNPFSKFFMIVGMACIHIAMLLAGMDQEE